MICRIWYLLIYTLLALWSILYWKKQSALIARVSKENIWRGWLLVETRKTGNMYKTLRSLFLKTIKSNIKMLKLRLKLWIRDSLREIFFRYILIIELFVSLIQVLKYFSYNWKGWGKRIRHRSFFINYFNENSLREKIGWV
jgi:hypothetical protein